MMRCFTILMALCCLASCSGKQKKEPPPSEWELWQMQWALWSAVEVPEVSRLVAIYSAKMKADQRLDLENSYVCHDGYIQKIYLEYSSQRMITFCEARDLLVDLVDGFLSLINNHTILSFQLQRFPFTAYELDVTINFESFYGIYVDPLLIGKIFLRDGMAYYYAFDIKDRKIDWSHQRFEQYYKSRELSIFRRQAELPYMEEVLNPPVKAGERYYDLTDPRRFHP